MGVNDARRLKQLEEENRKLKQLVADTTLDNHALRDLLRKMHDDFGQREAVHRAQEQWSFSERQACRLIGIHRVGSRLSTDRQRRPGSVGMALYPGGG